MMEFKIDTWWKKTLAVIAIGLLGYVGLMVGMTALTFLLTSLPEETSADLVGTIVSTLIYCGVVYFCYLGIARIIRNWSKSKKLRKDKNAKKKTN